MVEITDESQGTYEKDNQIRFKTSMLKSCLCEYSDAYILVKGTITVANSAAQGQANNGSNKTVIFKNCALFTKCISRTNKAHEDDVSYIDVVMPMYNLIEYSDNYLKASEMLGQFYRDVPALDDDGAIKDFKKATAATESFSLKLNLTAHTRNNGTIKTSK